MGESYIYGYDEKKHALPLKISEIKNNDFELQIGFVYIPIELLNGQEDKEQETIINYNADDKNATLYTRDPAVMRKVDALVIDYPETFKCIGETDIDKTYEMPKSAVTYRKPRKLSEEQRERARTAMKKINNRG